MERARSKDDRAGPRRGHGVERRPDERAAAAAGAPASGRNPRASTEGSSPTYGMAPTPGERHADLAGARADLEQHDRPAHAARRRAPPQRSTCDDRRAGKPARRSKRGACASKPSSMIGGLTAAARHSRGEGRASGERRRRRGRAAVVRHAVGPRLAVLPGLRIARRANRLDVLHHAAVLVAEEVAMEHVAAGVVVEPLPEPRPRPLVTQPHTDSRPARWWSTGRSTTRCWPSSRPPDTSSWRPRCPRSGRRARRWRCRGR